MLKFDLIDILNHIYIGKKSPILISLITVFVIFNMALINNEYNYHFVFAKNNTNTMVSSSSNLTDYTNFT